MRARERKRANFNIIEQQMEKGLRARRVELLGGKVIAGNSWMKIFEEGWMKIFELSELKIVKAKLR